MLRLTWLGLVAIAATASLPKEEVSSQDVAEYKDYLEKSINGDGVPLETRMADNPKASAWENSGHYQGDIVLDDQQVTDMVSSYIGRKAYIWPNTKWPQNTVVYEYASGHFTANQRQQIQNAMNDISKNTCVRFRPRLFWETNYISMTNRNDGCYASVGYWRFRGVHTFNLANNCFRHSIIVHEFLHVLGFLHMQSTYTRDNYVTVQWENVRSGMEHNFDMYSNEVVSNLGLPYEYASAMHYGRFGFSVNGQPTLLPNFDDFGLMGQQEYITDTDWLRVKRHYECPGAWDEDK